MGWLFQNIGDFFAEDDGSFPEICICGLSADQVTGGYRLIREKSSYFVGKPRFYNRAEEKEMEIDEVDDASKLVIEGKAQPFHFMVRDVRFGKRHKIPEVGVFILHNAIALDYEKGPLWGEIEIEALLLMILKLMNGSEAPFIKLEESVQENDRQRFNQALKDLKAESEDLIENLF